MRLFGFPLPAPGKSSSKAQTTPSKPGGDRYIPHRNASQMEVASFLLSKENHSENSQTPTKKVCVLEELTARDLTVYLALWHPVSPPPYVSGTSESLGFEPERF